VLSPQYEPLQYPLLFPQGTAGWSPPPRNADGGWRFSQIDWYKARLIVEPRFQTFGRLANEYLVDMYSRVEDQRLDYIRAGRVEHLEHFRQANHANAFVIDPDLQLELGSAVRLPSSFPGSRAWASDQVADALALCRRYGKPSLFITITCNPAWPEIASQLERGQTASDIPVVVCRIFKAKVALALRYIKRHFGKVIYIVRVFEFQKRGLPHVHMVIKVRSSLPVFHVSRSIFCSRQLIVLPLLSPAL
jgi:hypothetical protein